MICDECETVAHCMKNGCVPKMNKELLQMVFAAMSYGNAEDRESARLAIKFALAESALERMAENARELGLDYEQPAQRTWVGLTDEEIDKTHETKVWDARRSYARAIEAKLRERNT